MSPCMMPSRIVLAAGALAAAPVLALAQAPAASNPKLAAYAGRTCSYAYRSGTTVFDDFSVQGGNVVTHHHSKTPRASQDAGVISPQPVGDGTYRFKVTSGSVYVLRPHATPDAMTVTVTDGYGRGTATVTYSCQ